MDDAVVDVVRAECCTLPADIDERSGRLPVGIVELNWKYFGSIRELSGGFEALKGFGSDADGAREEATCHAPRVGVVFQVTVACGMLSEAGGRGARRHLRAAQQMLMVAGGGAIPRRALVDRWLSAWFARGEEVYLRFIHGLVVRLQTRKLRHVSHGVRLTIAVRVRLEWNGALECERSSGECTRNDVGRKWLVVVVEDVSRVMLPLRIRPAVCCCCEGMF